MDHESLPARSVAGRNTHTKNLPETTDIDSVVVDTACSSNVQDIVLCLQAPANHDPNSQGLQWISQLHSWYLPLHYVLFFPHCDNGWQCGMLK